MIQETSPSVSDLMELTPDEFMKKHIGFAVMRLGAHASLLNELSTALEETALNSIRAKNIFLFPDRDRNANYVAFSD